MARQAIANRRPLPKILADEPPTTQLGLSLYLQAFFDLDSERPPSFNGIRRIPKSAVRAYAKEFDFDDDQTDALDYYIGEMDSAYIKRQEEKHRNETASK